MFINNSITVHSNHHQGFDSDETPAPFVLTAWSDDGLPEAFEHEDTGRFLVGVLWHPERTDDGVALFRGLVTAARRAKRDQGTD